MATSAAAQGTVDGHQDLPSDGHEVSAVAVTKSDRVHRSSRRQRAADLSGLSTRCPPHGPVLWAGNLR